MPTYDYRCRACGTTTELDRLPAEGVDMRHLKEDGTVCGVFFRNWAAVHFKRVPGGARG